MNSKALLVLILSILYMLVAQWWYSTKIKPGVCCGTESAVTSAVVPAAVPAAKEALMFNWSNPATNTYDKWPARKKSILSGDKKDNTLVITGKYFEGETAPAGFATMGMARAAEIRKLFPEVPDTRIELLEEKVALRDGVKTNEFTNAAFTWKAAPAEMKTVKTVGNTALIYFPYNSTKKKVDPAIDTYLKGLADRLKNGTEKVLITGHTDDRGEEEANYNLGLRRAKVVRDILKGYGVPNNRITTESKGETQPAEPNGTERGWRMNRRTVVKITQ